MAEDPLRWCTAIARGVLLWITPWLSAALAILRVAQCRASGVDRLGSGCALRSQRSNSEEPVDDTNGQDSVSIARCHVGWLEAQSLSIREHILFSLRGGCSAFLSCRSIEPPQYPHHLVMTFF